ncbi:MAG: helix-turn-helix domain-containing protein [Patescibacteria group bacterium]|nr:helix-turn-helix domain-containing protein [Patescibacteria group bacterium]MDD5715850.1 helix-turn-helix domain-containing protein [Patescibacteria group bacterium]
MHIFSTRRVERSKTLGERLRKVREEMGKTVDEAAAATQIRAEYLAALERGAYQELPGHVYIEGFLREYARFLNVSADFVLGLYRQQEKKVIRDHAKGRLFTPKHSVPRAYITPKLFRIIFIVIVIGACLGYVIFKVTEIFAPPELVVSNPVDYAIITERQVLLEGRTVPEATVAINGKNVILSSDGTFSEKIDLTGGVNTITVTAHTKRSKEAIITRRVVQRAPDEPTSQ